MPFTKRFDVHRLWHVVADDDRVGQKLSILAMGILPKYTFVTDVTSRAIHVAEDAAGHASPVMFGHLLGLGRGSSSARLSELLIAFQSS